MLGHSYFPEALAHGVQSYEKIKEFFYIVVNNNAKGRMKTLPTLY